MLVLLIANSAVAAPEQTTTAAATAAPGRDSSLASPMRRIVLVRHAEKIDESPQAPLSAVGHARAGRLADLLAAADVQRIFVSDYLRTQQTAQPLADRLQITPVRLPAQAGAALLQAVTRAPPGGTTLVVGHSNTLPALLASLGIAGVSIAANDYGNVFIVVLPATAPPGVGSRAPADPAASSPTLIRLRY